MIRLDAEQRLALSETFRELANLAAGAFVLGQFVGDRAVSWLLMSIGAAVWIVLVVMALMFRRIRA